MSGCTNLGCGFGQPCLTRRISPGMLSGRSMPSCTCCLLSGKPSLTSRNAHSQTDRGRTIGAQRRDGLQDQVNRARGKQISSTELLAQLLQAPNLKQTAADSADSMTEEFFMMSSTYLDMANKEGNKDVAAKLEIVLKAAMSAKQATLRPEIQLLNKLLSCKGQQEREQVFRQPQTADILVRDNRYFFSGLLDRMLADTQQQGAAKANARQQSLAQQLKAINDEANSCIS